MTVNTLFLSDVQLNNPSSGAEQVLHQQVRGFEKLGQKIVAITRANGKGVDFVYEQRRIKVGTYFADTGNPIGFVLAVFRKPIKHYEVLRPDRPIDILIAHQPYTFLSFILRGLTGKIPVIYIYHSPSHEEYALTHQGTFSIVRKVNAAIRKYIEGFCIRRAQKVITLSQYMAQKAATIHQVPNRYITVNPGGANLEKFKPLNNRKQIKSDLNLPADKIHLFTLRNLDPRMGIENLLQAIKILKNEGMRLHLLIGGEGPERTKLQRLAINLELKQEVTFTGFIHADDLCRYYSAADFFILPTRNLEGFGLVTPEALACGTPVLATPVGGSIEILSTFNPALLFNDPSADAMASGLKQIVDNYFNDESKYLELRKNCRDHVESKYSWKRHVDTLGLIAKEVVSTVTH